MREKRGSTMRIELEEMPFLVGPQGIPVGLWNGEAEIDLGETPWDGAAVGSITMYSDIGWGKNVTRNHVDLRDAMGESAYREYAKLVLDHYKTQIDDALTDRFANFEPGVRPDQLLVAEMV
jgi:hypothetical protein